MFLVYVYSFFSSVLSRSYRPLHLKQNKLEKYETEMQIKSNVFTEKTLPWKTVM